jgi:hypothetical protein
MVQPGRLRRVDATSLGRLAAPEQSSLEGSEDAPTPAYDEAMAAEPRQQEAWTPCPGPAFMVRHGPNYSKTGRKQPSASSLYDVYAVDLFRCPEKLHDPGRLLSLPPEDTMDKHGIPSNLVLSLLLPDYAPALLRRKDNGPGWVFVMCCRLSAAARRQLEHGQLPPALKLWGEVVRAAEGSPMRKRLKCIMALVNPNELRLDSVSSSLVKSYNAKPFMCRSTGNYYRSERYFGVEADMHKWGVVALQGFNMLKAQVPQMLLRCGLLIQAEGNDEMPEQARSMRHRECVSSAGRRWVHKHWWVGTGRAWSRPQTSLLPRRCSPPRTSLASAKAPQTSQWTRWMPHQEGGCRAIDLPVRLLQAPPWRLLRPRVWCQP